MFSEIFSPAQCAGYIAFVLGVGSFLQRSDKAFKILMAGECITYAVHFALLGNMTAVSSTLVSTLRSVLSLYTRSRWVVVFILALNIGLGLKFATGWISWLPLTASCIGTIALFMLNGVAMRALMLVGSILWVANNIASGSIGGTALELVLIVVNIFTMFRLQAEKARALRGQSVPGE
ncbi:YgjV family protein [Noviherbaspirillum aerium]|uniref:YgjV family protein n=1 Tax=Noviherbaspirillum aerium TaxID=2588497 RepID=UPI001CEF81EB|nr:YgjV family protein [Noviherbaspirillum aerium]